MLNSYLKKKATIRNTTNNSVTAMPIAYEGKIKKPNIKIFLKLNFSFF